MKTRSYSSVIDTAKIPLILLTVEKIESENFDFVLLFLSSFFSFTLNSKTVRRIRMICTPNDCPTIRDFLFWVRSACKLRWESYGSKPLSTIGYIHFLCESCMWDTIGELRLHTCFATLFDTTFCAYIQWQLENYRCNIDVLLIELLFYHRSCLLSVLELHVRYDWRVRTPRWATCAYLHAQLENYRSHMDVLYIEWLLYHNTCLFSLLELRVIRLATNP